MNSMQRNALRQYSNVGVSTGVEDASPHRLIQMLMSGALSRISAAVGFMERGEVAAKGQSVSMAISIIDGLRSSLNHEAGGEISANLERLYDYMQRRLMEGNLRNEPAALGEVHALLSQIKDAWDQIPSRTQSTSSGAGASSTTPLDAGS